MMSRKIIPVATVSVNVNYIRYLTCFKYTLFLDIKFLVEFTLHLYFYIGSRYLFLSKRLSLYIDSLTFISG